MIKPGVYQHYKGNNYEVIGVARHSEDESQVVVYRPMYGEGALWVRPLDMFTEQVSVNGRSVERFRYIGQAAHYEENSIAV
ncbi:DUF1653 domain-containing protein [Aestuariibacter sp. GS-14]|uniref:DUF1653 domain-containing protein n=1 Tax=Aestuariibacter sp. GS-14 TaxID=2590670 RepID=UPI0011271926|nr:DUF1653 domain-containing protein [Aestuariibacter sp. GS-14]TPV56474.1 DUF1653 domain-containing protein [Aestuariibacter sp. GS-14]